MSVDHITTGAVWQHKREPHRRVQVTALYPRDDGHRYAEVRRNTSRRRQALRETTLMRHYRYVRHAAIDGRLA